LQLTAHLGPITHFSVIFFTNLVVVRELGQHELVNVFVCALQLICFFEICLLFLRLKFLFVEGDVVITEMLCGAPTLYCRTDNKNPCELVLAKFSKTVASAAASQWELIDSSQHRQTVLSISDVCFGWGWSPIFVLFVYFLPN